VSIYSVPLCHSSADRFYVADGGMHVMSAQVVRGLFQRLICTRFRLLFSKPNSASIVPRFRLHTIYPLHEINLDVHRTDL
jgi:hypothetical protein